MGPLEELLMNAQRIEREGSPTMRKAGYAKLREAMGGDPAFWGPLQQLLFGLRLYGRQPGEVQADMASQMGMAQDISQAVPRRY